MKTTIITIDGPVIYGKPRQATVEVFRHKTTSSVTWSVDGIDIDALVSEEFSRRLQTAGFLEAVHTIWKQNVSKMSRRAVQSYSARWGCARFFTHSVAEHLAWTVARFYAEAAKNLPTEGFESVV